MLCTCHGWGGASLHVRKCTPPPSPYLRIRLTNFAQILCVAKDPIVTRFIKVGGVATAHSHVRLQFCCLENRSTLTLKPHQKQTYLFRPRSYIATHGVLLVGMDAESGFSEHIQGFKFPGDPLNSSHFDAPNTKSAPTGYRRAPNIISHHYKQELSAKASIVPKARPIRFR